MKPNELLPLVYNELRHLAQAKLAAEMPGNTFEATALVHEVWLKLGADRTFQSKSDFFLAAAQAMRQILVDAARAKKAQKRGGDWQRLEVTADLVVTSDLDERLETLDEALLQLARIHPKQAELVTLHRFAGLTLAECAQTLGISARTADLYWAYARAWLAVEIQKIENA